MININKEIISIWKKYNKTDEDLSPLLYNPLESGSFLCIGINPSFSKRVFRQFVDEDFQTIVEKHKFKNIGENANYLINLEERAWEKLPYFTKPKELASTLGLQFGHLDIFYERETEQKSLEKKYFTKDGMTDFAQEQFDLSMRVIKDIKPKTILLANARGAQLFKEYVDLRYDEELGVHFIDGIPIFFSGMLSGGRALDLSSYARLKWHMKFVQDSLED